MSNRYNAKRSKNRVRADLRNSTIAVIYESQILYIKLGNSVEKTVQILVLGSSTINASMLGTSQDSWKT